MCEDVDLIQTIKDISDIIDNTNHNIKSISILLDSDDPDYILEDGHFGISKKIIKDVTLYCYDELKTKAKHSKSNFKSCLNLLMILNPDDYRIYNLRRQMSVTLLSQTEFFDELYYSSLPLKLKPKSNEPFTYKKWLMSKYPGYITAKIISNELSCCSESAVVYKNNYYAWTHRLWLIQNYLNDTDIKKELEWSRMFVERNISDFSGMNYRFNLLIIASSLVVLGLKTGEIFRKEVKYCCDELYMC